MPSCVFVSWSVIGGDTTMIMIVVNHGMIEFCDEVLLEISVHVVG